MLNHINNFCSRVRFFKKNEKGSFTLEASLIFPIIFLITLALLLISIVIYEQVYLYYLASQAAERTTYNWDNSYKNPYTGAFAIGEYDGLYWRLTDDRILDLFLNDNKTNLTSVAIGESNVEQLAEKKLSNIAMELPTGLDGELVYSNFIAERKVTVNLESRFKLPSSIKGLLGSDQIKASASSTVADPVEFIRNVNLVTANVDKLNLGNKDKKKNILAKQKDADK